MDLDYGTGFMPADLPRYLKTPLGNLQITDADSTASSSLQTIVQDQYVDEGGDTDDAEVWLSNEEASISNNVWYWPATGQLVIGTDLNLLNHFLHKKMYVQKAWGYDLSYDLSGKTTGVSADWEANANIMQSNAESHVDGERTDDNTLLEYYVPGAPSGTVLFGTDDEDVFAQALYSESRMGPVSSWEPTESYVGVGAAAMYSGLVLLYEGGSGTGTDTTTQTYACAHDYRPSYPSPYQSLGSGTVHGGYSTSVSGYNWSVVANFYMRQGSIVQSGMDQPFGADDDYGYDIFDSLMTAVSPYTDVRMQEIYSLAYPSSVTDEDKFAALTSYLGEDIFTYETMWGQIATTNNYAATAVPIGLLPGITIGEGMLVVDIDSIDLDDDGYLAIKTAGISESLFHKGGLTNHLDTVQASMDEDSIASFNECLDTFSYIRYFTGVTRVSNTSSASEIADSLASNGMSASDITFDGGSMADFMDVADEFVSTNGAAAPLMVPYNETATITQKALLVYLEDGGSWYHTMGGETRDAIDYLYDIDVCGSRSKSDLTTDGSWDDVDDIYDTISAELKVSYEYLSSLSVLNDDVMGWTFERACALPDSNVADKQIVESIIPYYMRQCVLTFGADYTMLVMLRATW